MTETNDELAQALHRKAIAEAERDAAIAEAEAVQARIASGHLVSQVTKKQQGVRLEQLFWLGGGAWFLGVVVGSVLQAPAGVNILIGIFSAWFAVWFRLHRVAVEVRREEAANERRAWLARREAEGNQPIELETSVH